MALPLLVAAFSVGRASPLPAPGLPAVFDTAAARASATQLARLYPDRPPGSPGDAGAARWVASRLRRQGFVQPQIDRFSATVPGLGLVRLENLTAVVIGRSSQAIVVMAHRDDVGTGPGANDDGSGTAALLELARLYAVPQISGAGTQDASPAHTLLFVSTDGGSYGGLGAARFAATSPYRSRILDVIDLDALAGPGPPRVMLAGDAPRSPPAALVETVEARVLEQTGESLRRPSALRQLVNLGFPLTLYEQGPLLARGLPAITLTTAGSRPPPSFGDTPARLDARRLGQLGRSTQELLASLDGGLEPVQGTHAAIFLGARYVRGWAIELVLAAALLPVLAAAVDLYARCRRRRISLAPALRSYRSRLGFWLWVGGVFELLALLGVWPEGAARPLAPESRAAHSWPVAGVVTLAVLATLGWLVARERLLPRRPLRPEEDLAGHSASLLVLGVVGLLVVALDPFALIFVLPSLHAWLWLPQVRSRPAWLRLAVLGAGFLGPALLLGSLASGLGLGLDASWYLAELLAVGYVPLPALVVTLGWLACAGQLAALASGRYAPYPSAAERPPRGPLRELVRRSVLAVRARRAPEIERRALKGG